MMWTPFAYPGSMPSEVICEMSEVRLCSIDRYRPEAPCSFASWNKMRYTNDDFREPGGPATRTMCPRGMPPLRRSSRPTTYVGILSVACDRMEPPPDPTGGTGQRSPADKTLSREVYGHHTGFESGADATPHREEAVPRSPRTIKREAMFRRRFDARDGCGWCPVWGRRQGENRRLPCRPRGRRRAVPGRRERGPHGPSGRPAVRVSSAAFRRPPKAHDEHDWERSGRRSGAAPDRDRGDPRPRPLGPEPSHQRPRPCRDAIPQDHRRPRGEIERQ